MNALRVETCMLYMYFKETSLISHASLESSNKESINQSNWWPFCWGLTELKGSQAEMRRSASLLKSDRCKFRYIELTSVGALWLDWPLWVPTMCMETLTHCGLVMAMKIWVNIGSANGLLPDSTKPLPEPMLTNHHRCYMAFNWEQFHKKY